MNVMLLAAGRGTRMKPLTDNMPKPLLEVGGKPLIVWHLERLADAGFKNVVINHAWLGSHIESYLGGGEAWGLNIEYSAETHALETAGGIAKALPLLGTEPFLVMNADVWCDWNPTHVSRLQKHLQMNPELMGWLLLVDNPPFHLKGDFYLQPNGLVEAEKKSVSGVPCAPRLTFSGIGIYKSFLFEAVEPNLPAKLAPLLIQAMKHHRVIGEKHETRWVDVGTPERLAALDHMLLNE